MFGNDLDDFAITSFLENTQTDETLKINEVHQTYFNPQPARGRGYVMSKDVKIIERDHLIPGFLTKGKITLLGAQTGTGKTTFVGDFVIALMTAGSFFGGAFHVKHPTVPLVVICEGDEQDIVEKTKPINPDINYPILNVFGKESLDILGIIQDAIINEGVEVVIFDSFTIMASRSGGDANNNNEAQKVMDTYALATASLGVTVVLTMHVSNKSDNGRTLRGASGYEDTPSYIYIMNRVADKDENRVGTVLLNTKSRYGNMREPIFLSMNRDGRTVQDDYVKEVYFEGLKKPIRRTHDPQANTTTIVKYHELLKRSGRGVVTLDDLIGVIPTHKGKPITRETLVNWIKASNGVLALEPIPGQANKKQVVVYTF